jgi:hypothetical protein
MLPLQYKYLLISITEQVSISFLANTPRPINGYMCCYVAHDGIGSENLLRAWLNMRVMIEQPVSAKLMIL